MFDRTGKRLSWILGVALCLPIVLLTLFGRPGEIELSLLDQLRSVEEFIAQGKGNAALIRLENNDRQGEFLIYLDTISSEDKLRLDYDHVKNVSIVAIEIPKCQGCDEFIRHETRIIDYQRDSFYFGLNDTDAKAITIRLHGYSTTRPIEIGITALGVVNKGLVDRNIVFVVLMLGVAASLIFIGAATGALLRTLFKETTPGNEGIFLVLGVFVFSILMLPALLLLQTTTNQYGVYLLVLVLLCFIFLVVFSNRIGIAISDFLSPITSMVVFYLVASVVIAVLLGFIDGIALQEYFWSMVGKYRVFYGHIAHDNAFQYLNGLAIAEDKPFKYFYYTNPLVKGLFYGVEDRQMLPGSVFAIHRVIWAVFSPYVINTYAFYTIFGTCLTMLIFFPIYAFFTRYFDKQIVILSLFILVLTTYVLGNLYYTWFKILGGALVLSGVYFLYLQPSKVSSWILAGLFWGLAANIHAGQVIVYPLLLLFFVLRQIKFKQPITLLRYTAFSFLLTGIVITSLLPWEMIKSHYYPGDLELFRTHFLRNERYTGDIVTTIGNFLERYTLEEQLVKRTQQLTAALRFDAIKTMWNTLGETGIHNTLIEWNRVQYRYIAIMVYPLLLMLLLVWLAARFINNPFTRVSPKIAQTKGAQIIFNLAVACIIWGLLLFFTKYEADFSGLVSPFSLIVVNMFMITLIASYSRFGLFLIMAYAVLGAYKLAIYYRDIIVLDFVV